MQRNDGMLNSGGGWGGGGGGGGGGRVIHNFVTKHRISAAHRTRGLLCVLVDL